MEEKQRFLMLIGLAGAGKSTVSSELVDNREDIVYISSDLIRLEMFGDVYDSEKNKVVFSEMLSRTKKALEDGKHVVYDATNTNRKRRKGLLQELPKDVQKVACYIATDYETTVSQNENRKNSVPKDYIDKTYKNFHMPIYSEGWDKIVFFYHDNTLMSELPEQYTLNVRLGVELGREGYDLIKFLASYFNDFFGIYDLPQDSKYHSLSVSRHTYYVYKYVLDNYEGEDKELMLWTALLHDVGKSFCKNFYNRSGEETRYANFIGHEFVGAQMAVHLLKTMNFDDDFIYTVATLIQFHMYLLDESANREKLLNYVGEDNFKRLEFLRDADVSAH